jgi:hypothetical protein
MERPGARCGMGWPAGLSHLEIMAGAAATVKLDGRNFSAGRLSAAA